MSCSLFPFSQYPPNKPQNELYKEEGELKMAEMLRNLGSYWKTDVFPGLLHLDSNQNQVSLDDHFKRAQALRAQAQSTFEAYEQGRGSLRYKRVFRIDEYAMTLIWSLHNDVGAQVQDIAMKIPIQRNTPTQSLQEQWSGNQHLVAARNDYDWMEALQGHEHIVQLVNMEPHVRYRVGTTFYNTTSQIPIVIVMEALQKCSLLDLIERINHARWWNETHPEPGYQHRLEYIPNRILWRLLLCMLRSIAGLAYPRSEDVEVYREGIPAMDTGPQLAIHGNINPSNFLIGEKSNPYVDTEHVFNPTLKLFNFSTATLWDDSWSDITKELKIKNGNPTWLAPEQLDPTRARVDPIGPALNIYGIGITMFNLITLRTPSRGWLPRYRVTEQPPATFSTWGWPLLPSTEYRPSELIELVDHQLRILVALCMADSPNQRPDLGALLETTIIRIEQLDRQEGEASPDPERFPALNESDDLLTRFYVDYFTDPPFPSDPYEAYWEGGDAAWNQVVGPAPGPQSYGYPPSGPSGHQPQDNTQQYYSALKPVAPRHQRRPLATAAPKHASQLPTATKTKPVRRYRVGRSPSPVRPKTPPQSQPQPQQHTPIYSSPSPPAASAALPPWRNPRRKPRYPSALDYSETKQQKTISDVRMAGIGTSPASVGGKTTSTVAAKGSVEPITIGSSPLQSASSIEIGLGWSGSEDDYSDLETFKDEMLAAIQKMPSKEESLVANLSVDSVTDSTYSQVQSELNLVGPDRRNAGGGGLKKVSGIQDLRSVYMTKGNEDDIYD
ncbi:kinase-like domain-containing protein [Hypoxylon trugodes]|uniref:kinase-like domain-containing protein n=1 Tax=Hypoxylon trugodes TaxID=326681 RepID=UPI0021933075|nr:kinase-like domain-containing protein [Hypoxylon trugodes]KAI1389299.1 kinase-like domain-containing protein [Hypoxylon trugodes]